MSYDSSGKLNFNTGPITAAGVAFQRGRQIVCVDPYTGQNLWKRSSSPQAEVPQQADIFGDDELLFIADARLEAKADDVLVLSALDGSVLGHKKIDSAERRWATHGRRVLAWEEKTRPSRCDSTTPGTISGRLVATSRSRHARPYHRRRRVGNP